MCGIDLSVGQYDVVDSLYDGGFCLLAQGGQCLLKSGFSFISLKQHGQLYRFESFIPDIA